MVTKVLNIVGSGRNKLILQIMMHQLKDLSNWGRKGQGDLIFFLSSKSKLYNEIFVLHT